MLSTSPLAPVSYPALPAIDGVMLAAAPCGIRYKNRADLLLVSLCEATQVAGVFTQSLTASAPVLAGRTSLKDGQARVLVVNSGNSNAFTGRSGEEAVANIRKTVCELFDCPASSFFMASTGVIGEKLPYEKMTAALPQLSSSLTATAWEEAAQAIMTTDTYPKMATRQVKLGDKTITINGIAKGSGMIAPNMATMLAFIFTDAAVPSAVLQELLQEANSKSFNSITVDGDTSTSDTVLLFATGKAENAPILTASSPELNEFRQALHDLMLELALHIVKDGEGAEKLIRIDVTGAESESAARTIGMSIGNSPLVKTALAAGDANWGRIVMAVGKAGQKADRDKLCIHIGGVSVARNGEADPNYRESDIEQHMKGRNITIEVDVGVEDGKATVWTCDLTHRYIDINADYRT